MKTKHLANDRLTTGVCNANESPDGVCRVVTRASFTSKIEGR